MGKLICDSTASSPVVPWRDPTAMPSSELVDQTAAAAVQPPPPGICWESVPGLEDQQRSHLTRLYNKGVLWKHPEDKSVSIVFRLMHGGEVEADGNCLFTAVRKSMGLEAAAQELRRRTVRRFVEDLGSLDEETKKFIESTIRHMYSPDLKCGWGIHVVQEVKLLAKKQDREVLESAIDELVQLGMQREMAAESIYKERCIAVDDGPSWAKYMSISGSPDDEYDIINMQYTEEGLLTIDENSDGRAAAFGDDIAIECLATEFKREIFVLQAHGSDAMVDEDNCVFFLPHRPRSEICGSPFFLFMKGTGWCGAGADHYEPLIAHGSPAVSQEKVALAMLRLILYFSRIYSRHSITQIPIFTIVVTIGLAAAAKGLNRLLQLLHEQLSPLPHPSLALRLITIARPALLCNVFFACEVRIQRVADVLDFLLKSFPAFFEWILGL